MFKKLILWSIVLIAIATIFYFSTESGSISQVRTHKIAEFVAIGSNKLVAMDFGELHLYIRKGAHFFEYMTLAVLMSLAIRNSRKGAIKQSIGIFLLCFVLACFDERIQTFTAGRSGNVIDVLIDGSGAFLGIILYSIVFMIFEKVRYKLLLLSKPRRG